MVDSHDITELPEVRSMSEEGRLLKVAEAEKAEQERQAEWARRADVVYHFFAYRYFDRSTTCLDLLNFSDADIDSFNLTANKARGLNNWHVFADYLKNLVTPTPDTNTYRRKFIHHVHSFNKTIPTHFQFFLRNLTVDDIEYVDRLCKLGRSATTLDDKHSKTLIWASSCVAIDVREEADLPELDTTAGIDTIEAAVEKCLEEYRKKLRMKVDEKVKAPRDELDKKFENIDVNGPMVMEHCDKKDAIDGS